MGLLGDVYSYGDTLKRKVGGLLNDPRGTLEQFVGQLGDDMNTNISNMKTGYGFGGNKSVLSDPAQVQAAQRALADYGAQSGMAAATVWHGSPHKFDKFDSSKIGTGEGAQAYGHGLYLAESQDVARTYTTSTNHVAKQDWVQLDGVPYRATQTRAEDTAHNVAADALSRFDYDKKAAMGWLENYGRDLEAKKIIKSTKKFGPTNDPATSMYKVDLPDDQIAKMLDWDKPLSKQPKNVRDAYKKYLQSPQASEHAKAWTRYSEGMRLDQAEPLLKNPGGENLYKNAFPSREAANQWASENGIPGIRYLDGGSRGAGQGSSNFVVFPGNEGLLSILERNGQALK